MFWCQTFNILFSYEDEGIGRFPNCISVLLNSLLETTFKNLEISQNCQIQCKLTFSKSFQNFVNIFAIVETYRFNEIINQLQYKLFFFQALSKFFKYFWDAHIVRIRDG